MNKTEELILRGVVLPAPEAVSIDDDIDVNRIEAGAIIFAGSHLTGKDTFIGAQSRVGQGGGAWIENCQIGRGCTLMQGCYRDSTLLDGANARNGAEIRDNCLLEEDASLGHTVGLKQTIFMTNVVAGSLINFCDALISGGRSRKDHSEIGSCMALYNFTPQGDKFASLFGDPQRGVFLDQAPIFIGGQTQIISPVQVGFGSIIAAGTRLTHDVAEGRLVSGGAARDRDIANDPVRVNRPRQKVAATYAFIRSLDALKTWYERVRRPALAGVSAYDALLPFAIRRLEAAKNERLKRLVTFRAHIEASLQLARLTPQDTSDHRDALDLLQTSCDNIYRFDILDNIAHILRDALALNPSCQTAVQALPDALKRTPWCESLEP